MPDKLRRVPTAVTSARNDQELKASILSDNLRELEFLATHEFRRFCWRAYQKLGNAHDAEDAVQDALLSAFEHISQFEGRSKLSSWLTKIVINATYLHMRRARRPLGSLDTFQLELEDEVLTLGDTIADQHPDPETIYVYAEIYQLMLLLMSVLSPSLRKTFHLYYMDGLSASEVAELMDIPVGTVKARVSRVRARLKGQLQSVLG